MKITHNYPPSVLSWKDQQQVGNGDTEADVWEEIRRTTLNDDSVLLVESHQYACDDFFEEMNKGRFDRARVKVLSLGPIDKVIHVPAHGPYKSELVTCDGKVVGTHEVPARPAGTKTITVDRYLDLSTQKHAWFIALKASEAHARVVVFMEPDVEGGDLDYLHELKGVDVVIFHRLSEKYGVVVEGDVDPEHWEDEFPVMGECELPKVDPIIDELLIAKGVHVWAGMFESYKTAAAVELCSATLANRPVFDHFTVRRQYPILYLCPDMPPELFQEYARPFGLLKDKDFRWLKPGGDSFHMIDSAVMQRAVKGRILILDTMLDYAQIQKAYESGEWIVFFAKLRRLINVCGCVAIIMLVHPTKTGAKSDKIDPSEYLKDSVTFGGKIDVGFGFSKLPNTSQVMVERIKGRGFKKQQFSFTIAYLDEAGNSNLDRGHFPVYNKPGEAGRKENHVVKDRGGRKPNPDKDALTQQIVHLKGEGKSLPQIAEQLNLSLSTVKRYQYSFDATKEATNGND